jgi:acetolactate synthase small subunit
MLVDNEPGVLSRVVGLFSGRGFNIESLCVAETIDPKVSRITIVTKANKPVIEQIEKQLNKLINVIKLRDLTGPKGGQTGNGPDLRQRQSRSPRRNPADRGHFPLQGRGRRP